MAVATITVAKVRATTTVLVTDRRMAIMEIKVRAMAGEITAKVQAKVARENQDMRKWLTSRQAVVRQVKVVLQVVSYPDVSAFSSTSMATRLKSS